MSCKLIVMGVGGVGKSAITNRFVRGRWIAKYDPTIEESYQKSCEVDGTVLQVEILDTAGQDAYTSLRETFMHTGDGFMLVYSITDDDTLDRLQEIHEQIQKAHPDPNVPILIVGNKSDMEKDRAVTADEGKIYATKVGGTFQEVSAKNNRNVSEAFDELLRAIVKKGNTNATSGGNVFGSSKDTSGDDFVYASSGGGKAAAAKASEPKKSGFFAKCEIL